jgi:hypothetical protein
MHYTLKKGYLQQVRTEASSRPRGTYLLDRSRNLDVRSCRAGATLHIGACNEPIGLDQGAGRASQFEVSKGQIFEKLVRARLRHFFQSL